MRILHTLDTASAQSARPASPQPPPSPSLPAGLESMSVADRHHLANVNAQVLSAQALYDQRGAYGEGVMDAAVASHAPVPVAEAYQALVDAGEPDTQPAQGQVQTATATGDVTSVATPAGNSALEQKLEHQQEAQEAVESFEAGLAQEVAAAGQLLDPGQYEAFSENYKAEHGADKLYEALDKANSELADHLEANQSALVQQAEHDPEVAANLYSSLEALADTGYSGLVVSFIDTNCTTENADLIDALGTHGDLAEVLSIALGREYTSILADNGFDTDAAFAEFMDLVGSLKGYYSNTKEFADGIELLTELGNGNWDALDAYGQGSGGPGTGAQVFNFFMNLGSLVVLVNSAGTDSETYALEVLQKSIDTGKVPVDMLASHLQTLANSADDLPAGSQALKALGKTMGIASALLGAVISTINLDDPNAGDGIALAGKYLQTFGAVLAAIPGGQAAALAMGISGTLLEWGGELISTELQIEERTEALVAAGVDPAIAPMLARHGPELGQMAQTLGLQPEQAQQLLLSNPEIADSKGNISAFTAAAEASGMSGELVLEFASALKAGDPQYMDVIFPAWVAAGESGLRPEAFDTHIRDTIATRIDGMEEFLVANSDAYTAESQIREQARTDFEYAPAQNYEYVDRVHAENLASNPDPAYQAEYAALIIEERGLDFFIDGVLASANTDYIDAASSVVDQAEAQGLITAEEANAARERLGVPSIASGMPAPNSADVGGGSGGGFGGGSVGGW